MKTSKRWLWLGRYLSGDIRCDSERKIARAANLKSRKQTDYHPGMLVYYFRKGRSQRAKARGQWHGPGRVLFVEKTGREERGNQGSIVWVSHGVVLLRCAPEQLQPVGRDLTQLDLEINGPFSPEEFLKGKHCYQDLMKERENLEHEVIEHDELAWHQNPDSMRVFDDDDEENRNDLPDKRRRLKEKTRFELDTLARKPLDDGGLEPENQGPSADSRGTDDREHQEDVSGGARPSSHAEGQIPGNDISGDLDESSRLLRMVRRSRQGTGMGEVPDISGEEDPGSRGRDQVQDRQEAIDKRESLYQPIRGRDRERRGDHRGGGLGRDSPYDSHQDSRTEEEEAQSSDGSGIRQSERAERDDAADGPSSHHDHGSSPRPRDSDQRDHGAHGEKALGRSDHKRHGESHSPDSGPTDKRLRTNFQKGLKSCEIVLHVGPRDVHFEKHGRSGCWLVNNKVKRSAEVNIKDMDESEIRQMNEAKGKEVNSYMEHAAVEIASKCGVDPERIMGMRWILTWKNETNENNEVTGKRAKARLIIKGFQDPDLLRIQRDSPTLSTLGRNMLFAVMSQKQWELWIGDIKTAFLNGDDTELSRHIYGEPPDDVKAMLNMTDQQLFRIKKAIYGLLNAPRRWIEKLAKELEKDGWVRSKLEPCAWRLFDSDGNLVGILGVHVDDVICAGDGEVYQQKVSSLRKCFPFGSWKSAMKESVTFCGSEVNQDARGEITMKQERYPLGLSEIQMSRERKQQEDQQATDEEKKQMKGLLGAIAWRANQTAPWLSATTSILQGHNQHATVKNLLETNKLCRLQRAHCDVGLHFSNEIRNPMVLTFTDASHACRADGSSQGGSVTFLTDTSILEGKSAPFSILSWHSRKLKRISRSSTCAEVQACTNAHDDAEFIRQLMYELYHVEGINHRTADMCISNIPAAVICDAKNMYDAVTRILSSGLQLEEKRLCLEVLSIRERCENTQSVLRWVDSDQQVADDLTKLFSVDRLLLLLRRKCFSIVFDSTFTSAKKKRQEKRQNAETITPGMVMQVLSYSTDGS